MKGGWSLLTSATGGQSKISRDRVGASIRLVRYIWKCQGGGKSSPKRNPACKHIWLEDIKRLKRLTKR